MSENGTPFQRAGYTPEDWFEVLEHKVGGSQFTLGEKVKLAIDDGSTAPLFTNEAGNQQWYLSFHQIKLLTHTVKHICAFGDTFTTIPDNIYLEVSYTKNLVTVYLNDFQFPCKTEERFKEVMQAIQTLFKEEEES